MNFCPNYIHFKCHFHYNALSNVFVCNVTFPSVLPLHPAAISTLVIPWTSQISVHLGHLLCELVQSIRLDVMSQFYQTSQYLHILPSVGGDQYIAELESFKTLIRLLLEIYYFHNIMCPTSSDLIKQLSIVCFNITASNSF